MFTSVSPSINLSSNDHNNPIEQTAIAIAAEPVISDNPPIAAHSTHKFLAWCFTAMFAGNMTWLEIFNTHDYYADHLGTDVGYATHLASMGLAADCVAAYFIYKACLEEGYDNYSARIITGKYFFICVIQDSLWQYLADLTIGVEAGHEKYAEATWSRNETLLSIVILGGLMAVMFYGLEKIYDKLLSPLLDKIFANEYQEIPEEAIEITPALSWPIKSLRHTRKMIATSGWEAIESGIVSVVFFNNDRLFNDIDVGPWQYRQLNMLGSSLFMGSVIYFCEALPKILKALDVYLTAQSEKLNVEAVEADIERPYAVLANADDGAHPANNWVTAGRALGAFKGRYFGANASTPRQHADEINMSVTPTPKTDIVRTAP